MLFPLQTISHPADSAFVAGRLGLPSAASMCSEVVRESHWDDSVLLIIIAGILLVAGLVLAGKILEISSSVIGCFIRWKECVNLEDSARLCWDRNIVAVYAFPLFCLIASGYKLWNPDFMAGFRPGVHFLITTAVALTYLGLRVAIAYSMFPRSVSRSSYKVAMHEFYTFMIAAAFVLPITAALLSIPGVADATIRTVLLWEAGIIYFVHFIRKAQILGSSMSVFATFLYLCALELIPTAALVVSALFL